MIDSIHFSLSLCVYLLYVFVFGSNKGATEKRGFERTDRFYGHILSCFFVCAEKQMDTPGHLDTHNCQISFSPSSKSMSPRSSEIHLFLSLAMNIELMVIESCFFFIFISAPLVCLSYAIVDAIVTRKIFSCVSDLRFT